MNKRYSRVVTLAMLSVFALSSMIHSTPLEHGIVNVRIGADNNSINNPFVQPQNPALSGGGIDQTLQFGDVLVGTDDDDLLIGRLGVDVMFGNDGNDVLIGGSEHFNPQNRDRAFGGPGNDIFIWAPGDGSDFFDGGPGEDVLILGLLGEVVNGQLVFRVSNDQQAGTVFVDPATRLPLVDVTNSPGFCRVIDRSGSPDAASQLEALGLEHLVRFFLRGPANAFERGEQNTDNGLRVTMHLRDVEILICTSRNGGAIEAFDLTVSPPEPIEIGSTLLAGRLQRIVR